ncbi:septal ring lytic transglycosylase RlpA family protein [Colwellia sp. M166]|uniref:septal ring lytic transglycosylase RlpA family protein n=1 Tax=Colwellia sp. M166 TaxID=2583805 RepID=UPI00211E4932|nr:septal ring lytic transglycosylase RlpA family protein [Colwellia sp. M166]|tara:strand:+ start:3800 stop:4768 length:969 start_codon:yes stop_codon:yes gene_type:complete
MAILKVQRMHGFILLMILLSACSTNYGRYQHKHDSTPSRLPSVSELHDATPRAETHSRGGNKHYQVRGKHYQVLKSAENFSQTGTASWYGRKFHGHLTSNGEIYDMYAMSAAHKNLPLPTYLKVVNNNNGRSVIVRVNDRGPFHQNRIIDLSYSAAYKLDMLKTGTANVTISAITDFSAKTLAQLKTNHGYLAESQAKVTPLAQPTTATSSTKSAIIKTKNKAVVSIITDKKAPKAIAGDTESQLSDNSNKAQYIQIFASSSKTQATKLLTALSAQYKQKTQLEEINGIFRVLVGPIERSDNITKLLLAIKRDGYPNAFVRK